jgi:riboflavin kinase / FMN adenylyltransferase
VKVARSPHELVPKDRAVAIGSFDGVHLGHRRVLEALVAAGPTPTVVTFDPHPRLALGYGVELLSTPERRLELLAEIGIAETLVVEFTLDVARLEPEEFAHEFLEAIGTRVIVANDGFRFGHGRRGNLELLRRLGFEIVETPLVEGVSSTEIRRLVRQGDVPGAAALLGRPVEVEGTVVAGDARGGTLGFPTANLAPPANLIVPAYGIYAGAARGRRAAVSIGTNPHYGGAERRVEAFLLDFAGDLYGQRLVLELWERLRDEQVFGTEHELIEQIARDVDATRRATRPE